MLRAGACGALVAVSTAVHRQLKSGLWFVEGLGWKGRFEVD